MLMVKAPTRQINGPEAFAAAFPVSRETLDRLGTYAGLLKRWQKTINLVAPSTVNHVWHRHFADSAQVYFAAAHAGKVAGSASPSEGEEVWRSDGGRQCGGVPAPPTGPSGHLPLQGGGASHWLDIGSGAGFPGLVIAILAAEHGGTRHTLIESDSRKAAFLREVARATGVVVDILCMRIEIPETRAKVGEVNCITARALAPLPRLIELAYPYFGTGTAGIFSKGREVSAEIEDAARAWQFEADLRQSVTDPEGTVLVLKSLTRR